MPRGANVQRDNAEKKESTRKNAPRRSATQKAQDELEAAKQRVVKASDARAKAQENLDEADAEYRRAVQLHDHVARHPDLPRDDEADQADLAVANGHGPAVGEVPTTLVGDDGQRVNEDVEGFDFEDDDEDDEA